MLVSFVLGAYANELIDKKLSRILEGCSLSSMLCIYGNTFYEWKKGSFDNPINILNLYSFLNHI